MFQFLMCWHSVLQNSDDSMKAYLSLREFIANHSAKETDGVIIKPRKIKRRKIQKEDIENKVLLFKVTPFYLKIYKTEIDFK